MSINVIDNFEVGVSKPIDNRFVVGPSLYYTNRDFISYKYTGLRIWDLNDNLPYVWTGATWSNETTSGTVNGSGNSGYVTKFIGSSPSSNIGDSAIFESGGNVGIGTTTFGTPVAKLQVTGRIRTTVGFYGDGFNITGIDGSKIIAGSIPVNRLTNGSINQLLSAGSGSAVWVNPSSVTVGNATNAANVNIITDNVNSNTQYIPFVSSTGNQQIKINTTNSIKINPSNGHVGIGGSARATPRLYVNGGASIGTTTDPPSINGLIVGGNVRLSGNVGIGGAPLASTKLYLNGGLSVGTTTNAPANGLIVGGDVKISKNTHVSVGNFFPGIGTESITTKITVSSSDCDRMIYVYTNALNNAIFLNSGHIQWEIDIQSIGLIFTQYAGADSGFKSSLNWGFSFLLPAGREAYIKQMKNGVAYSSGTSGIQVNCKSVKLGIT